MTGPPEMTKRDAIYWGKGVAWGILFGVTAGIGLGGCIVGLVWYFSS